MAWLASAGHVLGTGLPGKGEEPQPALPAVGSWKGQPSWGGQAACMSQELSPDSTGISSNMPRSVTSPCEHNFNTHPPALVHIYICI